MSKAIGILLLAFIAIIALAPVAERFWDSQRISPSLYCQLHVKQLNLAVLIYAEDYDRRLPPAERWTDAAAIYAQSPDVFQCPKRPKASYGYGYNRYLDRQELARLVSESKTPLLFESGAGVPNTADQLISFVAPHRGQGVVGWADGHAKLVRQAPSAQPQLKPRVRAVKP